MKIKDEKQLWKTVLAQIEVKLDAPATFKTFFQETKLINIVGNIAHIGVPNPYTSEWLKSRYERLIKDTISYVYGEQLSPEFEVLQRSDIEDEVRDNSQPLLNMEGGFMGDVLNAVRKAGINPKHTMSTYIVGNPNRFAHAASLAVMENPGVVYNPLFIHGKTGLGKTHLAQAIARGILEKDPSKKIVYTPSEGFLNEMVKGIKAGGMDKFRAKYRPVDLLIIDDMQLISKWVHTQEEFFNTFNELYNAGKQIILIADRRPEEIKNIESRIKSRMQGGVVADVGSPDYEMRLAILLAKAENRGINLKPQILEYIARTVTENIRELEGALQKVALFNSMKPGGDLTLEEVAHTIGKDIETKRLNARIPHILKETAKSFDVRIKDLKGPRRTKDVALARQVAMYILREEYNYKLEEVAKFLNREDHTTVLHAVDRIKTKMMRSDGFNSQVSKLITNIQEKASITEDID